MRRRLLIVLLAMGTVGGYASGFARLAHHRHSCHSSAWGERWDDRWERRWGSRGPSESWESRAPRGASAPSVAAPSPSESPAPGEGAR